MFPPATSRRFCFHTNLPFPSQPPAPLQPTGGKHVTFVRFCLSGTLSAPSPLCRHCRHFVVTVASLSSLSELQPLPFFHPADFCLFQPASGQTSFVPFLRISKVATLSSLSPLCRHCRHFVTTVATFSSPSPVCRHCRHFCRHYCHFCHYSFSPS